MLAELSDKIVLLLTLSLDILPHKKAFYSLTLMVSHLKYPRYIHLPIL
jgi:hypothetical protein